MMLEDYLRLGVSFLVSLTEAGAALIIFAGALVGFFRFIYLALVVRKPESFVIVRLDLGRFLALGLEFQLASDLLRTAVSPSFEAIGKLAAVATIRTALNYFLNREIRSEREEFLGNDSSTAK